MTRSTRLDRRTIVIIAVVAVVGLCGLALFVRQFMRMGFHKGFDQQFGDQHLKTAVALIELHRVRTGAYPDALSDLRHTGQWDQLAIHSVRYCPSPDHKSYYVEVTRGWIGKPTLTLPPDFWTGTGYRAAVAKDCP